MLINIAMKSRTGSICSKKNSKMYSIVLSRKMYPEITPKDIGSTALIRINIFSIKSEGLKLWI